MSKFSVSAGLFLALVLWQVSPAFAACDGLDGAVLLSANCGGISYEGCCENGKTRWCAGSGEGLCESPCDATTPCGWLAEQSFYDCGGTDQPPAEFPITCSGGTCTPDCTGKECGDDGCGGTCGSCPMGETCSTGICQGSTCTPNCTGKECGDDGCGGLCGTCGMGETCLNAQCTAACQPNCEGAECGVDGCGGSCGSCQPGETCENRVCVGGTCTPNCTGKECGDDGCGGFCGFCGMGLTCVNSMCEEGGPTMDIVIDWDTISEDDGSFITVDIKFEETGKDSSGSCAASGSAPASLASLLLLLGLMVGLRRFRR